MLPDWLALVHSISIVIPILNGQAHIPELIRCLESQECDGVVIECLLIDNGSTDGTVSLLQNVCRNTNKITYKILLEHTQTGSSAARNCGVRHSSGDIIAFTDVDCRPEKNWLKQIARAFKDQSVGIVAGSITPARCNSWLEVFSASNGILSHKKAYAHSFLPFGQTANLAVRRTIFETQGLFRLLDTGSDADFCWRMQQAGKWRFILCEQAIVAHCHRKTITAICDQFRKYGRSRRYLHCLYRFQSSPFVDLLRRIPSWCAGQQSAELSAVLAASTAANRGLAFLFKMPLMAILAAEYLQGYYSASLPDASRNIEYL